MSTVAVLTPLHGHAMYIGEMLTSLQAQTFEDWECCVVIDGYDEQAIEVVDKFVMLDDRISMVWHQEKKGVAAARNLAASLTDSEWLLPFDADDVMKPTYLHTLLDSVFPPHPDGGESPVVFTAAECIRADGTRYVFAYPPFNRSAFTSLFQIPNASLHHRILHDALGGWDERWVNGAEDWHYWTRAVAKDLIHTVNIREAHWCYREHDGARNSRVGARHWLTHKATLDRILSGEDVDAVD